MSETVTRIYAISWQVRNPYAASADTESFDDIDAALACARRRLWTGLPFQTVQITREERDVTQVDVTATEREDQHRGRMA